MARNIQGIGFGVPAEVIRELDAFASGRGISRSEAARTALAVGLPMLKLGIAINGQRALTILEHTQLALSLLIDRQYPEDSHDLVRLAMKNVREHHG